MVLFLKKKKKAGVELNPQRLDHTLSVGNETAPHVFCVWMDGAAGSGGGLLLMMQAVFISWTILTSYPKNARTERDVGVLRAQGAFHEE